MADDTFYGSDFGALQSFDPDIAGVLLSELDRIRSGLQLIASENLSSPAVLTALGSTLSNKYRGLSRPPLLRRLFRGRQGRDHRHRAGQGALRRRPCERPGTLGCERQPGRLRRFMSPGDTILAMALPMGGHLTHGTKVSFSGKWFNAVHYGVDRQTEDIDYDQVEALAREHRPKVICAGGSAISAAHRLPALPGHRRRGRRDPLGRRGPLHRPRRRQGHPVAGAVRRRRDLHDPQGAARPALRRPRVQGRARRGPWTRRSSR